MYFGKRILASAIRRACSSSVRFSSRGSIGVLGGDVFPETRCLLGEREVRTTSGASSSWGCAEDVSTFAVGCGSMAKLSMMGRVQGGHMAPYIWKAFATHPILSCFATHPR